MGEQPERSRRYRAGKVVAAFFTGQRAQPVTSSNTILPGTATCAWVTGLFSIMMIKRSLLIVLILALALPFSAAQAQDASPPPGPVYIVQPGDSMSLIASRFGVTLADLMAANNISDPNNLAAGAKLIIPGLEGISGVLKTEVLNYGDTLHSISRRNRVPEAFVREIESHHQPFGTLRRHGGYLTPAGKPAAALAAPQPATW